jgi:hypothetical protein
MDSVIIESNSKKARAKFMCNSSVLPLVKRIAAGRLHHRSELLPILLASVFKIIVVGYENKCCVDRKGSKVSSRSYYFINAF